VNKEDVITSIYEAECAITSLLLTPVEYRVVAQLAHLGVESSASPH